jgi:hypothetical protein
MSARATVALAAAAAVMLALLVAKVMAASTLAGTLLLCALGIAGLYVTARLIGPAKGEHAVPRGFTEADERLADTFERVIPRAITEHAPPWDPAPAFHAAPVIEPDAVTHGPPEPPLDAWIVAKATVLPDGQVTSVQLAAGVEPAPAYFGTAVYTDSKIRAGMLPAPVARDLGYPTVADALASMYRRADALALRAKLEAES